MATKEEILEQIQPGKVITAKLLTDITNLAANAQENLPTLQGQVSELSESISELTTEIADDMKHVIDKKISRNIYDPSLLIPNKQLYMSGAPGTNNEYDFTGYIDVSGCKSGYITIFASLKYPNASTQNAFYDENKNPVTTRNQIGDIKEQYSFTTPIPAGAKYFGIAYIREHYINGTSFIMVQDGTEYTGYEPYGEKTVTVLPSDEVKEARGDFDTLDERLTAIDSGRKNIKKVTYWGDSLTQGNQDGTRVTRATVLKSLLGDEYEVNNFGVGGEKSNAIASRQGGMNIVINPGITIPGNGSYVTVDDYITDNWGKPITFGNGIYGPAYEAYITVNPCYVNGVECTLYKANASSPVQIKRNQSGDAIVVERPTTIVTNGSNTFRNRIAIIWVGQNQGFDIQSPQELVEQIKAMIEWNGTDKYIVLGLGYETYTSYGWQVEVNKALKLAFGRHYIDVGGYLRTPIYQNGAIVSSYGMADNNLTPTEAEIELISEYKYPTRLLASDGFHFSQYGYKAIANLEYKRGKELGYWE